MTAEDLVLEINESMVDKTAKLNGGAIGAILITPPIDESYWKFRVAVSDKQAIVGFPKFGSIGIGFQHEDDWNTNLPSICETEEIYNHIECNKADDSISRELCIKAIEMIKEAVEKFGV